MVGFFLKRIPITPSANYNHKLCIYNKIISPSVYGNMAPRRITGKRGHIGDGIELV
jgi:hypothetical protein